MEEHNKLKFKRDQFKNQINSAKRYYDDLNLENLTDEDIIEAGLRLEKIEPILSQFEETQNEIEYFLSSSKLPLDAEIIERDNFEQFYFKTVTLFKKLIASTTDVKSRSSKDSGNSKGQSSYHTTGKTLPVIEVVPFVKLPKVQPPSFSGAFDRWLEFRDAYNSLIHENASLAPIQKFYYLKSLLRGEPLDLITSIEVSSSNYNVAYSLLCDRYENKKLIVHNYVKAIFDSSILIRESSIELRKLYDTVIKNLRSLKTLGLPTDEWDCLIIHLLTCKFDNTTRRDWESYPTMGSLPTMEEMSNFLKNKCELLERIELSKKEKDEKMANHKFLNKPIYDRRFNKNTISNEKTRSLASLVKISCYFCKQNHSIFQCEAFRKLDVESRINKVNKLNLCFNCLNPSHNIESCVKSKCRVCNQKHNTMLHTSKDISGSDLNPDRRSTTATLALAGGDDDAQKLSHFAPAPDQDRYGDEKGAKLRIPIDSTMCFDNDFAKSNVISGHALNKHYSKISQAILSTAVINIYKGNSEFVHARVLLDPGSQSHFITDNLVKKLGLNKHSVNYSISGVGEISSLSAKFKTDVTIGSRLNDYKKTISCLIIPKITQNMPIISFDRNNLSIPTGINLADPTFNESGKIDLLLGVGLFYNILLMEQIKLHELILQNTLFGYVIGGELNYPYKPIQKVASFLSVDKHLDEIVSKFWKIEECNNDNINSKSHYCERHFVENFRRNENGHFVVKIPFKENLEQLGDSREIALKRFNGIEKRFNRNPKLKSDYCEFMQEYLNLGHMTKVENHFQLSCDNELIYYLPHHAVVKESSLTTKVRVVFDASAQPNKGLSLNEVQHVGPTIQDDLVSIILRFRIHKYVLNADVTKMYRQVFIDPKERRFQRIFWRDSPERPLEIYELNTVTYGTSSAPFLAIRSLHQLGLESQEQYPLASKIILNDFLVDDLLTGSDSVDELKQIQSDVSLILKSGGFQLRKWLSNKPEVFNDFHYDVNKNSNIFILGDTEPNKTLGIYWNAKNDTIQYSVQEFNTNMRITKRTILSIISQIFDPLGLLQPIIVSAKILIQQLWLENLGWDDEIPSNLRRDFIFLCDDLQFLNTFTIPRHVLPDHFTNIELHGFADASEKAYGACIYICANINNDIFSCKILCAKSRVAPIKNKVTLPRLELSAALLLTKLMKTVLKALRLDKTQCFYWSDSTVTLYWIKSCPNRWKTFVSNRVTAIQEVSNPNQWFHVRSTENPADIVSRGCRAENLINSLLYWNGPEFISQQKNIYSNDIPFYDDNDIPEQKFVVNVTIQNCEFPFDKFSSIIRLQRTMAYCCRFISNSKRGNSRQYGSLTATELQNALHLILRISQIQSFLQDYYNLKNKRFLQNSSKLISLNPFIDNFGLLRVGGRLENAKIDYNTKHPIILENKHHVTKLIMMHEHYRLMHCGAQQLLYSIREKYWPISGRRLARNIVKNCIRCFKAKPVPCSYIMGHLPEHRVNQYIPFTNTGIDYAGPVRLKDRLTRNPKYVKGYICIFICLSTKCMHLELITSLTTDAFIATLKRFISRRGKPLNLFSDNGTTFVGADHELHKFFKLNSDSITNNLSSENITWHFIPPRAPNFGGIWEANIKQIKYHLKRLLGGVFLTYEDYCTVLTQIEGILNSRPICPLSSDPNDPTPLTPAHFLIGKAITSIPEPSFIEIVKNRLKHFEQLQQIIQQFWQRWYKEYIGHMQSRLKWKTQAQSLLKLDNLVMIKEDNLPTFEWKVGRVTELHPGGDNITRVATVKCSDGSVVKRAISKLCILPIEEQ